MFSGCASLKPKPKSMNLGLFFLLLENRSHHLQIMYLMCSTAVLTITNFFLSIFTLNLSFEPPLLALTET